MRKEAGRTYVALDSASGNFLGFAGLYTTTDAYAGIYAPGVDLVQIAVMSAARGRGIGRQLMNKIEDHVLVSGTKFACRSFLAFHNMKMLPCTFNSLPSGAPIIRLFADRPENVALYAKLGYSQGVTAVWGEKTIHLFEKPLPLNFTFQ